jgi:iron complex transport system substrate-binding protein
MRSMRRRSAAVAVAAVLVLVLASALSGCGRKKTFTDGTGRAVTLKGTPKRIVSLNPAHTETLFALGLGDKVVGVDNYSYWPAEAQKKEKVGDALNLNLEKIVGLKPDLVVLAGSKDRPPSQLKDMERLGIPAYVSGPSSVKEVLSEIEALSRVVGAEKQGKDLVARMQKDLDAVAQAAPKDSGARPTVFYVVDADLWTVGPGSFVSDIISTAGGRNVIQDAKQQYLQVSMEEVLAKDPDVILVAIPLDQAAALTSRPGWSDLRAVKAGKVFFVNADLTSRPGPSVVDGVKEVARCLSGK